MASLRDLGGFSVRVFGTRVLFYLNRNADNLLIGRFLGPAALGAYAVAYNVMLAPMSRIARPVVEVLFPAFSRMQDDPERIGSLWLRANRLVAAITIPAMAGLMVVASEFVTVVLGDQWSAAVPVIQILAWVGLMQSLQQLNSSILQARDRTGDLLRYSVIVLVASLTAFGVGIQWGIVGVAAAYAVSSTIVEPYYAWLTMRALDVRLGAYLRHLSGVATAALGMVAVVAGLRWMLLEEGVPAGARLALLVACGALTFGVLCAWRAPEVLSELRVLRRRRRAPALGVAPGAS
jgi:O-antigen/teichoic acid export membrane protein